jgi:hypothetical protein
MRAERFGIGPPFPIAEANVHKARALDIDAGFPRYLVVGVALAAIPKMRGWNSELRVFLRAAVDAVRRFNTQTFEGRIIRVGVVADNLLPEKVRPDNIITAVAEAFGSG